MGERSPRGPDSAPIAALRGAVTRLLQGGLDFTKRVYHKAGQDDIFFLAGGIAFNIMLGAIPFALLLAAGLGYLLRTAVDDPQEVILAYVETVLPASPAVREMVSQESTRLMEGDTSFGVLGLVLLVWVSTRLIGSLRSALRDIFDIPETRGILAGKLFDAQMVVVAGTLFIANIFITVVLEAVQTYGEELLGLRFTDRVQLLTAALLAYALLFAMFALIYRYLPARRVPWRIALVSATFSTVVFELLKSAFAWYVAYMANYGSTYGYLATTVVLIFWIYYSAVVFVLGGEVGQVYELYRIRRRQRELLD